MLDNWMKRLSEELEETVSLLNQGQVGRKVETFFNSFPSLEDCNAAIIGVGPFSNAIRKELYQMQAPFGLKMADIGNIANATATVIQPVLQELHQANILPIIIGGSDDLIRVMCQVTGENTRKKHPLFVDERIAYGKVLERSYLNSVMECNQEVDAITVMGYQKHLSSPEGFHKDHDTLLHSIRLSQLSTDTRAIEPYVRDCTSLSFSLNALKKAEAPNKNGFNPSGLKSEEACQICRYAGINEQLGSLHIHGMNNDTLECGQTATLVAQMIWYFLDGVNNRMSEYPIAPQHLTEYIVTSACWNEPLHFFKSMVTGRWWMAHPHHVQDTEKMIPCTYDEYLAACRDEIPDRIITLIS